MVVAADSVKMDPQALRRVEDLFHQQIHQGIHPGAALSVYRYGQPVLDIQGGLADQEAGKPVSSDTMFVLFSSTKPLAAACLFILWERGKFDWDDRVSKFWPGFGQNGKETVTIRHIMNHQGGFPDTPHEITLETWADWDAVVLALEKTKPIYEPGTVLAYHPRNFGWVVAELVQRIDGRPFPQFLIEELTGPLGMRDTYVGLPESLEHRVSRLHATDDCDSPGMVHLYNRPAAHRAVQPSGGGIATARDLAKFFAMMQCGGELGDAAIMTPETVAEVTKVQVEAMDLTNERPVRRSLGLVIGDPRSAPTDRETSRTFGHGGAGTSVGWADPDSGVAMAYITNGYRSDYSNFPRLAAISQAVREACL